MAVIYERRTIETPCWFVSPGGSLVCARCTHEDAGIDPVTGRAVKPNWGRIMTEDISSTVERKCAHCGEARSALLNEYQVPVESFPGCKIF